MRFDSEIQEAAIAAFVAAAKLAMDTIDEPDEYRSMPLDKRIEEAADNLAGALGEHVEYHEPHPIRDALVVVLRAAHGASLR